MGIALLESRVLISSQFSTSILFADIINGKRFPPPNEGEGKVSSKSGDLIPHLSKKLHAHCSVPGVKPFLQFCIADREVTHIAYFIIDVVQIEPDE